jgi:hypothetical protein
MVVTALVVVGPFAGPIFAARARASPCLGAGLDVGSIRGIRLSLPGGLVARSLGSPTRQRDTTAGPDRSERQRSELSRTEPDDDRPMAVYLVRWIGGRV